VGEDAISSLAGQARGRYVARLSGGVGRSQRVPSRGVPDRVRRARRLDEPDLPSAVEACRPLVVVVRAAAGFVGVRLRVAQLDPVHGPASAGTQTSRTARPADERFELPPVHRPAIAVCPYRSKLPPMLRSRSSALSATRPFGYLSATCVFALHARGVCSERSRPPEMSFSRIEDRSIPASWPNSYREGTADVSRKATSRRRSFRSSRRPVAVPSNERCPPGPASPQSGGCRRAAAHQSR